MGIAVNRVGNNSEDNIIDPLLSFDTSQTWSTTGTGSASLDTNIFFSGVSSLKLLNTAPTTDLVATNTTQSTIIPIDGNYRHSFYLRKDEADEFMTVEIETFVGVSSFNTQTYVLGSETTEDDIDQEFQRFFADVDYNFSKGDEVTFKITLKGKAGTSLTNTSVWIDGMMLENVTTNNKIPSAYKPPLGTLVRLNESDSPTVSTNQGITWVANASGTLDGTSYERGDLIYTGNSNGTQKTVIVVDFSAS